MKGKKAAKAETLASAIERGAIVEVKATEAAAARWKAIPAAEPIASIRVDSAIRCSGCGLWLETAGIDVTRGSLDRWRVAHLSNTLVAVEVEAGAVVQIVCNSCVVRGAVTERNRSLCACGTQKAPELRRCSPCLAKEGKR